MRNIWSALIKWNSLGTKESCNIPPELAQAAVECIHKHGRSVGQRKPRVVEISVGRGILFYFYIIIFGFFNSNFNYYFYSFQSIWAPFEGVGMTV